MGSFLPSDGNVSEDTNNGGQYDTSFSRCALECDMNSSYAESPSIASLTTAWIHFALMRQGTVGSHSTQTVFEWLNESGSARIRIRVDHSTQALTLQYWNGSAWTTAGSSITLNLSVVQHIDLNVVCNSASGYATLYVSGTQRITSGTIDLSGTTALDKIRLYGTDNAGVVGYPLNWSQVIVADEPTVGWRLKTIAPTGAGATTSWTGGYTEIDEAVYSDADFINSSVADQVELFAHGTTIPDGYSVQGIVVTARAKRGVTGPQNLQLALRSSGTTYFSSSKALDVGYSAYLNVWETDPATSAAFTTSAITSLQFGVKSIT